MRLLQNGKLMNYECFQNGVKEEEQISWMANGNIRSRCTHKNGETLICQYFNFGRLSYECAKDENGKWIRYNCEQND